MSHLTSAKRKRSAKSKRPSTKKRKATENNWKMFRMRGVVATIKNCASVCTSLSAQLELNKIANRITHILDTVKETRQ